jgi:RNA polymerase sigma-70 factor (sigma-E family)
VLFRSDSGQAEFDEFVRSRVSALSRTAYLLTGDSHLAEDLLQQALLATAKAWHRIEGDPEPYVRKVLYNQNISWWRRRRLAETSLETYAETTASPETGDRELRLSLETALAQLTLKQRTILVLRYFEDLTEAQTADALGLHVGTVKSTSRKALDRLRALAPHLEELIND